MEHRSNLKIVEIQKTEVDFLSKLAIQTFLESYYAKNDKTLFKKYVTEKLSPEQLLEEWEEPNSNFYFAEWNGDRCGYLKLNFNDAQTEEFANDWMEIERIYLLRKFQGKQIGTALFNFAREKAHLRRIRYIWVGVWKENQKAIQFYKRMGFKHFASHQFDFGGELQEDYIMRYSVESL